MYVGPQVAAGASTEHFFRIWQPIQIFTGKPKFDRAPQEPAFNGNLSLDPELAFLLHGDVLDVDFRIAPRKSERTFVQVQTLKRFLPGKLSELVQKRNIVDSPVINAQQTVAG